MLFFSKIFQKKLNVPKSIISDTYEKRHENLKITLVPVSENSIIFEVPETVTKENDMIFKMEYLKQNGEITIFEKIEIVGTYEKDLKTEGFKVYDSVREVYRNVRYAGIQTIEAA